MVRAMRTRGWIIPAAVLVALRDDESREESVAIASALRSRGIPCEVAPTAARRSRGEWIFMLVVVFII